MRGRSDHDPSMIRPWKRKPQPASQVSLLFEVPRSTFYCKIQRFAPNLTLKPSPNTAPTTKRYTWPSPSAAPATKSDTWTSPSTAPATQNGSRAWLSSHMKPHFQCAEQQVSRSNLTKYCACHTKWLACLILVTYETSFPMRGATGITIQPHQILRLARKMTLQDFKENLQKQVKRHFQCGADPTMIRAWSEHDPTMIRPWKRKPQPASQVSLLFEVPRSIFYCKIQRFAPNLTFKPSPNTAPTTKRYTWPSPSAAPATKSDTWTSPSTAPATKSDITNFSKYCTCHEKWHFNFTKYCAGHCTVTELYCTLLYLTLLYVTLLYLTLLYLTLLDTTLRDTTLLGSYSTWRYSTWPAPLDLTLLRCRSYIGSFST